MVDPLAEMVALLRPVARFTKVVDAAGAWCVRRTELGDPFYCLVLDGTCRLVVEDGDPITLGDGDFVLIPAARNFTMTSLGPVPPDSADAEPVAVAEGRVRLGEQSGPPDVRLLIGHCVFEAPDAALLVSLLPELLHIRGENRLARLVELVGDESGATRPARDMVLARLLEVLFIEALRATGTTSTPLGLLRGLADERLATAIRRMHEQPGRSWTVDQLAREAALSRSVFFERFRRALGMAPMRYLLAWRMAVAKNMLCTQRSNVEEIAEQVGYGSASSFTVAFSRYVGQSPMRFAKTADG